MKSPRMVILLVDALGWELANGAPGFARGLGQRRRLDTILGFSTGALPTLFTGRMPDQHGRFVMYRRALGQTAFSGFGALRFLPSTVLRRHRVGRTLTAAVSRRGVRGYFHLYEVPRWLLPEFDLPERDDIFAPGGLPVASFWDTLESRGVQWEGRNWRTSERENLAWLDDRLERGNEELLFCYTADLDALLHREGSSGPGVQERLSVYSRWIESALERADARGEALWIYLLSDHGMVDVSRTVDVMSCLRPLSAQWPRDYLPFFDSTMARFWWHTPAARDEVRAALAGSAYGRWLDDEALARERVLFDDRGYGEDIFLLDPGNLLLPSFMGTDPVAAMHGYDPSHPAMAALLWSNRAIPSSVQHLRDVRAFFEAELDAREREMV